jgi:hypothetical protein
MPALLQYNDSIRNKIRSQNNDMRKVRKNADCVALQRIGKFSLTESIWRRQQSLS